MRYYKKMTMTVERQKWVIIERNDGKFDVMTVDSSGRRWQESGMTFQEAGCWVWNMADNHDISRAVNNKMCERFSRTFA